MKRLKLNLDQLGQELETLELKYLRGIKGGSGEYGGYDSMGDLWNAMQNGYIPPEGTYTPGGYGGYGDWGDFGGYGGYNNPIDLPEMEVIGYGGYNNGYWNPWGSSGYDNGWANYGGYYFYGYDNYGGYYGGYYGSSGGGNGSGGLVFQNLRQSILLLLRQCRLPAGLNLVSPRLHLLPSPAAIFRLQV